MPDTSLPMKSSSEVTAPVGSRWAGDGNVYVILPEGENDFFMMPAVVESGRDKGERVLLRPADFGGRLTRLDSADA